MLSWIRRGNLYGTTSTDVRLGAGTVFKLKPPSTIGDAWERVNRLELRHHRRLSVRCRSDYGCEWKSLWHDVPWRDTRCGNGVRSYKYRISKPTSSPTPTPAATPTPGGTISLSADPVDFPNAGLGEAPTPKTLVVQNLSAKHALVGDVGGPLAPFSITSGAGAFDLGPLGMLKVKMMFTPTGLGLAKGLAGRHQQ